MRASFAGRHLTGSELGIRGLRGGREYATEKSSSVDVASPSVAVSALVARTARKDAKSTVVVRLRTCVEATSGSEALSYMIEPAGLGGVRPLEISARGGGYLSYNNAALLSYRATLNGLRVDVTYEFLCEG